MSQAVDTCQGLPGGQRGQGGQPDTKTQSSQDLEKGCREDREAREVREDSQTPKHNPVKTWKKLQGDQVGF